MSGFEHGVARHVIHVAARGDADPADLSREGVGNIVAIEIHRRDHVEFVGAGQDLLQSDIGDRILDDDLAGFACRFHLLGGGLLALLRLDAFPLLPGEYVIGKFALRQLVAPVTKCTFGEFHDVALVHDGDALAFVGDRVFHGRTEQPLGSLSRCGLEADAGTVRKTDLRVLLRKILLEQLQELLAIGRARFEFDAGVDVLGVLAEDGHVDFFRSLDRRWDPFEPSHRPQAHVQVEQLPQRHVERADAAADGSGERAFDGHEVVAARRDGLIREPGVVRLVGLLAGEDLHPMNLALAAIGLVHGGVENPHARAPDVAPGTVALDERDDRLVRHVQLSVRDRNFLSAHRDLQTDRRCF